MRVVSCLPLIFGVAFGNLLQGVPFSFDADMRVTYSGSFWQLLNPFGLLAGVVSLSMLLMHGAVYLQVRTEGIISDRARRVTKISGAVFVLTFILAGIWIENGIDGYRIVSMLPANVASTPLDKVVEKSAGVWLNNYNKHPLLWLAPILGITGALLAITASAAKKTIAAFACKLHHAHRGNPHRWHRDVPVRHAVEFRPAQQPDHMGLGFQSWHAANHVLGGSGLPADRARLHRLGVPGATRQNHGRDDTRRRTQRLLKGTNMWYFSWILGVGLAIAFGIINVMWLETDYFCKLDIEKARKQKTWA